jgi:hypothetical protein
MTRLLAGEELKYQPQLNDVDPSLSEELHQHRRRLSNAHKNPHFRDQEIIQSS